MSETETDLLSTVLAYVKEHGWYVFRLRIGHNECKCDGGTVSCKQLDFLDRHWRTTSSNDPDVVAEWDWSGANAYGIDCGKSGLVVVDQDPGATWPYNGTRVHTTGRGQHHIYEDIIGIGCKTDVRPWGVDVRGVGGMVVGPGSWHPHGAYAVAEDVPNGLLPAEPARAFIAQPKRAKPAEARPLDAFEALSRIEGVYHSMASARNGSRNHRLNVLAGTAAGLWVRVDPADRRGELSEERIKQRLMESVPDDGDPAKTESTVDSGWRYGLEHPVSDDEEEVELDDFFDQTDTLRHIQRAAHSRGIGATSVLAAVLAQVALHIPVGVDLPAVVGTKAPLNIGFALVGDSGASKSSSEGVADELLDNITPQDWVRPLGSGEGMIDAFYEMLPVGPKGKLEPCLVPERERSRLFATDEGESLKKLTERSGTTLGSFLRTALTGGMLGTGNTIRGGNNRKVPRASYRLVMIIGIHPDQSDVLLSGEGNGLPQRFVWMPADDPSLPDHYQDLPDWPGPLEWEPPEFPAVLDYPEEIQAEVRQRNLDKSKGKQDRRLGHATLTQLKIAQLLAVLHGENTITGQWWHLAGVLLKVSLAVQDRCGNRLGEVRQQGHNAKAIAESRAVDAVEEDIVKRASKAILRKLQKAEGGWVVRKTLRGQIAHQLRPHFNPATDALVAAGQIEIQEYANEKDTKSRRMRYVGENR